MSLSDDLRNWHAMDILLRCLATLVLMLMGALMVYTLLSPPDCHWQPNPDFNPEVNSSAPHVLVCEE